MNQGEFPSAGIPGVSGADRRMTKAISLLLVGPIVAYIVSLWMVRPMALGDTFSLTLMAPAVLVIGLLTLRIPRVYFLQQLRKVGAEFILLSIIVVLSFLSIINHDEPIRSFRIIFPSVLPLVIFFHLVVMKYLSPGRLEQVPRMMIGAAFLFSVIPGLLALVVPPIGDYMAVSYRVRGMFENSIQHSIALGTIVPLVVVEFALAKTMKKKVIWTLLLLLLAFTTFRAGSKFVLGVSFSTGLLLYALLALRTRSFIKISVVVVGIALLGVFLWFFGLPLAELINPTIAEKLRSIIEGGVANYQSVESRKLLWDEALAQGKRHWLIGTGAGEKVHGISHSHNLVLDYFKGIGIFGAISIALLCLTIVARTVFKGSCVVLGMGGEMDVRVFACYVSATNYVICNQMSDCFGPSTVGFLWVTYLAGRMLEPERRTSMRVGNGAPIAA